MTSLIMGSKGDVIGVISIIKSGMLNVKLSGLRRRHGHAISAKDDDLQAAAGFQPQQVSSIQNKLDLHPGAVMDSVSC